MEPIEWTLVFEYLLTAYRYAEHLDSMVEVVKRAKKEIEKRSMIKRLNAFEGMIPRLIAVLAFISIWRNLFRTTAVITKAQTAERKALTDTIHKRIAEIIPVFDETFQMYSSHGQDLTFFEAFSQTMKSMYVRFAAPEWDKVIHTICRGAQAPTLYGMIVEEAGPSKELDLDKQVPSALDWEVIQLALKDHFSECEGTVVGMMKAWVACLADDTVPAHLERLVKGDTDNQRHAVYSSVYILSAMVLASENLQAAVNRRLSPDFAHFTFALPPIGLAHVTSWTQARKGRAQDNYNRTGTFIADKRVRDAIESQNKMTDRRLRSLARFGDNNVVIQLTAQEEMEAQSEVLSEEQLRAAFEQKMTNKGVVAEKKGKRTKYRSS